MKGIFLFNSKIVFAHPALIRFMQFFILQVNNVHSAANYLPMVLQLIFAIGFIATMIGLTHYFI
jgi:hypothetical protein